MMMMMMMISAMTTMKISISTDVPTSVGIVFQSEAYQRRKQVANMKLDRESPPLPVVSS